MAIHLSDKAAARVQHFIANRGKGIGLRLGVKTTGCSGLAYVIEFVDELQDDDEVFESKGVKIIVDKKSLVFLDGTEVDFARVGPVAAARALPSSPKHQYAVPGS